MFFGRDAWFVLKKFGGVPWQKVRGVFAVEWQEYCLTKRFGR